MNEKGFAGLLTIMIAVTIIVTILALVTPLYITTTGIRGENNTLVGNEANTGLNCNTTTDDYVSGACIISDLFSPFFVAIVIGLAGLIVGAKVVLS